MEDFVRKTYARGGDSLWLISVLSDMLTFPLAHIITVPFTALFGNTTILSPSNPSLFIPVAIVTVAMMFLIFLSVGLYSTRRFKPFSLEVRSIVGSVALMALISTTLFFLLHLDDISRISLFVYFVVLLILLIVERYVWRKVIQVCFRHGIGLHKLLLVGSDTTAKRFYEEVVKAGKASQYGLDYIGYVALAPNEKIAGYLGGAEVYRDILSKGEVKEVLTTSTWDRYNIMGDIVVSASRFGVRCSVISIADGVFVWRSSGDRIENFDVATLNLSPHTNPSWAFIKRAMDIVGGLIALILRSPFMLYAAIVIKKNSPSGPLIFRQKRCGLHGKPFTMYKFRTMVPNAEELKASLDAQDEAEGPVFKMKDDPRIFKGAKFLRSSSIDELPQLINVLNGTMSLVGPRPPLPSEVEKYKGWEWARLSVKPGLTCYWQISGRSSIGFEEWMHLDLEYVRDQCFTTDIQILLKTFVAVFSGKGAF
jgi:exopolysaccharide biosynthesis polyprenyl glycosylphosphotransferase